ncbi:unnamed protein product [Lepeophtheirus salmonis]|uniref:(salmon louse) hypothetical protein n=1 Tax=Lepeophtheirus salmonis TaxID=72036 RepID=A0A7R8D1K0_LEPSM|nr:unnamed protein product [Lepeophtheirus salmonis]CAF2996239.1 unnamed protein product [Lepeophtheirus salmonis]
MPSSGRVDKWPHPPCLGRSKPPRKVQAVHGKTINDSQQQDIRLERAKRLLNDLEHHGMCVTLLKTSTTCSRWVGGCPYCWKTKKSARIMAVIGGLTLALGTLFTSFVTQFHQLFISYGVIIAISVSMIRDSSTLMIGQYFKKNREVIEIFFVGSTGFGLTVMSSLTYTFISHYKWRLGLQIITIIVSSSFILGTFFRSASLYHPQRRAILHLKSRKVFNDKCKMMFKSYPYFDFSAFKNSTNVQILVLSAAMSSAGFVSPILLLTFDGTTDGFSTQDILIFNINLGLGWSMGCGLFGFLIFNMSEECKIPRQYLSQSCLIVGGISVILFAMVVENSSGYYIFVWVYGISLGGFQYCIKMTIFQKVRSRNFSQTWSILQLIQGLSMGVIFIFTCYLNWKFTNKCGYYFCGSCLILGCIGLYLITLRNTFIKQTSIDKLRHKNDKLKRTLRFNSEGLNHSKRPPYSDHLYQKANSDENQLEIQKYEKIDEVDGNNEADEDVNYLPKSFIEDIANLNEITSCSKVEKNILQSEIENCILQRQDDPQELNSTKSNGRGNTNFYLSIVDYKLFLQRYSGQSQLKA